MIEGYYYLHTNGELIYKPSSVLVGDPLYFQSDFVRKVWPIDLTDRALAWDLIIEALSMGANRSRIDQLAEKWRLTDKDARRYAERRQFSLAKLEGGWIAAADDPRTKPPTRVSGLGPTALDAIADLVKKTSIECLRG